MMQLVSAGRIGITKVIGESSPLIRQPFPNRNLDCCNAHVRRFVYSTNSLTSGRREQDDVGDAACGELGDKGRPDGTGFRHAVDKDFGALGHMPRVHLYIRRRGWRLCLEPPAFDAE